MTKLIPSNTPGYSIDPVTKMVINTDDTGYLAHLEKRRQKKELEDLDSRMSKLENGLKDIKTHFSIVSEIPLDESIGGFALNGHIVHGHQYPFAIIQKGNTKTIDILHQAGFKIYEVDTSEFMKSGGSVFCMKMMHY